jgi:hypothetical protein
MGVSGKHDRLSSRTWTSGPDLCSFQPSKSGYIGAVFGSPLFVVNISTLKMDICRVSLPNGHAVGHNCLRVDLDREIGDLKSIIVGTHQLLRTAQKRLPRQRPVRRTLVFSPRLISPLREIEIAQVLLECVLKLEDEFVQALVLCAELDW